MEDEVLAVPEAAGTAPVARRKSRRWPWGIPECRRRDTIAWWTCLGLLLKPFTTPEKTGVSTFAQASNPAKYRRDWTDEGLRSCGLGLRNYLTLSKWYEISRKVLKD